MTGRAMRLGYGRVRLPGMNKAPGATGRGFALLMAVLLVGPALLATAPAARAIDDTAEIAGVWSGSGPGTATTTRNGAGGIAEFKYEQNLGVGGGVPLTTWTFTTTAAQTGTANLAWTLEGLHAWFAVTVGLQTFVDPAGAPPPVTVETLLDAAAGRVLHGAVQRLLV